MIDRIWTFLDADSKVLVEVPAEADVRGISAVVIPAAAHHATHVAVRSPKATKTPGIRLWYSRVRTPLGDLGPGDWIEYIPDNLVT